jgi:hypothetical protein
MQNRLHTQSLALWNNVLFSELFDGCRLVIGLEKINRMAYKGIRPSLGKTFGDLDRVNRFREGQFITDDMLIESVIFLAEIGLKEVELIKFMIGNWDASNN